ncbi:MAG: hypothetical protein IT424_04875 [Pirellulales bacterium]|nr:hypothetical protein [Pirellulales bacterium]
MTRTSLVLALGVIAASAGDTFAGVLLSDGFDGYTTQAQLEAAWPSIATTTTTSKKSIQLSSAQTLSAPNSVFVPVSTTATSALTEYRNRRSFTESGVISTSNKLTFSFDFYDVGTTASPSPQRNYANLQDTTAPGGTNQLVSLGLNNNQTGGNSGGNYYMARILGYTTTAIDPDGGANESVVGSGAYFKLNDFGVGLRAASAAWVNLKVVISTNDNNSTDYAFYVNNQLAERVENVGTAASIRSYDNVAIGSGLTNGVNAYFDNFSVVTAVPEASSFLALAAAGLSSLAVVWTRKKRTPAA